jgi:hypothetical protein
MTWRKKQAGALRGTAVTGAQALREGFTEITSGRSRQQQGLVAPAETPRTRLRPKERRATGIDESVCKS